MALKSSNKVDTNVYEIEVTVAPEEFTQACKDAYLKRRKSIQLPGFRKGKATQGMIEKLYGEGFFYEDALEIVYPAVVTAAIEVPVCVQWILPPSWMLRPSASPRAWI